MSFLRTLFNESVVVAMLCALVTSVSGDPGIVLASVLTGGFGYAAFIVGSIWALS